MGSRPVTRFYTSTIRCQSVFENCRHPGYRRVRVQPEGLAYDSPGGALGLGWCESTKPCKGAINSCGAEGYRALSGLPFRHHLFTQGVALGYHI